MIVSKVALVRRTLLSGLYVIFGVGWIVSMALAPSYATNFFEALFAVVALLAFFLWRTEKHLRLPLLIAVIYTLGSAIYAVSVKGTHPLDFALAFKSFYYLILLIPFCGKEIFRPQDISRLNKFVLRLFFVIYAIKRFGLGDDRPTVLVENNFELIFLSLVFYANYLGTKRIDAFDTVAFIAIVAMSGSRSSAVAAALVLGFCIDFSKLKAKDILAAIAFGIVALAAVYIFISRTPSGLSETDRVRFFNYFLSSTEEWTLTDFIFGAPRITPLPEAACAALSFYQKLFSYSGDGKCYSVIFHSFNLRVIYDHGIAGALFLYGAVWAILYRHSVRTKACVILVILATGMSISALNNVYAITPIALLAAFSFSSGIAQTGSSTFNYSRMSRQ